MSSVSKLDQIRTSLSANERVTILEDRQSGTTELQADSFPGIARVYEGIWTPDVSVEHSIVVQPVEPTTDINELNAFLHDLAAELSPDSVRNFMAYHSYTDPKESDKDLILTGELSFIEAIGRCSIKANVILDYGIEGLDASDWWAEQELVLHRKIDLTVHPGTNLDRDEQGYLSIGLYASVATGKA